MTAADFATVSATADTNERHSSSSSVAAVAAASSGDADGSQDHDQESHVESSATSDEQQSPRRRRQQQGRTQEDTASVCVLLATLGDVYVTMAASKNLACAHQTTATTGAFPYNP